MLKFLATISFFIFYPCYLLSQFAPAVGKVGSTAIPWDSSCFVNWAYQAQSAVGYRDISQPDSGYANVGSEESAVGKARSAGVISLGDSGSITLYFPNPIVNQPGYDFAVFENAFNDSFLELAHVEVSLDGVKFYRIPSESLTPTQVQTPAFGSTKAEEIHNLAGKYRMPYGTPFDISDLDTTESFFPTEFYWVRIQDVVGCINPRFGTTDSKGRIINDPWPTNFGSSGFDLDAVGVIHQRDALSSRQINRSDATTFWFVQNGLVHIHSNKGLDGFEIFGNSGEKIFEKKKLGDSKDIILPPLASGAYVLKSANNQIRFIAP